MDVRQEHDGENHRLLQRLAGVCSTRTRTGIVVLLYVISIITVVVVMFTGFRSQIERRKGELTRELRIAYETVISTVSATPEFFYTQIAGDDILTGIMAQANHAEGELLESLHLQLLSSLREEYELLKQLDFRQLHFHLKDNRSFLRFHRPDRYNDDLTEVRATVRRTNATQTRTYGFEEGRIYNGFRYVYPLFHQGLHVGSVEASMNYRAIISRMKSSHPSVNDFILHRDVMEEKVFQDEQDNYQPFPLNQHFVRESSFARPDTGSTIGVDYTDIIEAGKGSERLKDSLDNFRADTVAFFVKGVPITVSLLPVQNVQGRLVAYIISYSHLDEFVLLRSFFILLGLVLSGLVTSVFASFHRMLRHRQHLVSIGEDLQRTIGAKDRFFSIVSHDLRSPMGSIASLSRLLSEELREQNGVSSASRELADAIADASANSLNLMLDLLDWSRAQGGDLVCRPELLPLKELIGSQLSSLERMAGDKAILLENRAEEGKIFADEYMLKTVVRNLVSNGIKFSHSGGSVVVESRETDEGTLLMVIDTGVGMSEEQQQKIFDLSEKVSTRGTSQEAGTGLGLTVCREFVHQHGGTISVVSRPGEGSSFRVFFPGQ